MAHESLLVVSTRGESIGRVIHYDGDETFLVERGMVFPDDFEFHCESITRVSDDGALVYTVTEYLQEQAEESPQEPPGKQPDTAVNVTPSRK